MMHGLANPKKQVRVCWALVCIVYLQSHCGTTGQHRLGSYSVYSKRGSLLLLVLINVIFQMFFEICHSLFYFLRDSLTLILLTWRIGWAPNNASRGQIGFNLAFKGLTSSLYEGRLLVLLTMVNLQGDFLVRGPETMMINYIIIWWWKQKQVLASIWRPSNKVCYGSNFIFIKKLVHDFG
jgi:hypothetical protein